MCDDPAANAVTVHAAVAAWAVQPGSGADRQRSGVETLHGVDRRDPLGPALDLDVAIGFISMRDDLDVGQRGQKAGLTRR